MIKPRISKEVVAAINARGESIDEFLRKALAITPGGPGDWTCKGVTFPEGTFFRAWFGDRPYWGVVKAGALEVRGERFSTPSAAAVSFMHRPTNGWEVWECRFPGSKTWRNIGELRKTANH